MSRTMKNYPVYFELKMKMKPRGKTNQMILNTLSRISCPFVDLLLKSEVFTAVKIQTVFFMVMKIEAAVSA